MKCFEAMQECTKLYKEFGKGSLSFSTISGAKMLIRLLDQSFFNVDFGAVTSQPGIDTVFVTVMFNDLAYEKHKCYEISSSNGVAVLEGVESF